MNKYRIKFQRDFEVDVEAEGIQLAEGIGKAILAQFPKDTCKLLSIEAHGEVAAVQPEKPTPPFKPRGRPNGGGTPGTPVVRQQEVLVDQIAQKVA